MNESTEQPAAPQKPTTRRRSRRLSESFRSLLSSKLFLIVLVVIIAMVPTYYFYHKSRVAEQQLNNPTIANKKAIDDIVSRVSRHIILPKDEQPTLASITDIDKVKEQPFFTNAQNGDKVLVYTQSRKAYLYRPGIDRLVEVAPLNVDTSSQGQ